MRCEKRKKIRIDRRRRHAKDEWEERGGVSEEKDEMNETSRWEQFHQRSPDKRWRIDWKRSYLQSNLIDPMSLISHYHNDNWEIRYSKKEASWRSTWNKMQCQALQRKKRTALRWRRFSGETVTLTHSSHICFPWFHLFLLFCFLLIRLGEIRPPKRKWRGRCWRCLLTRSRWRISRSAVRLLIVFGKGRNNAS